MTDHTRFRGWKTLKDNKRFQDLMCFLLIAAVYIVFHFTGIHCPIRFLTGVSCMGCGMTRAIFSAIRLHFSDAFSYHPLWMIPGIFAVIWWNKKRLDRKSPLIFQIICGVFVIAFIAVYVMRLLDPNDTIVVFEPKEGFIFRCMRFVFPI